MEACSGGGECSHLVARVVAHVSRQARGGVLEFPREGVAVRIQTDAELVHTAGRAQSLKLRVVPILGVVFPRAEVVRRRGLNQGAQDEEQPEPERRREVHADPNAWLVK